jgi:FkbM family methyltransferase
MQKPVNNTNDAQPMDAQADATTMEVQYLRPMLDQLPPPWRTAVDVGAHRGDVTAYLAAMHYRVLAVEPHPQMADRLEQRFAGLIPRDLVRVARCAASERDGEDADFYVGSATTVNTLEPEWTTRGFPEHFTQAKTLRVPLRRVDDLVRDFTRERLGFLKVDVEGHEYPALRGCFSRGSMIRPAVLMFETFSRFPGAAEQCLLYLARQGYGTFDIFVRHGQDLSGVERFRRPELPDAWRERHGTLFYANVIAYHPAAADSIALPNPAAFFERYQQSQKTEKRNAA